MKNDSRKSKFIYGKIALETIMPEKDIPSSVIQLIISVFCGVIVAWIVSSSEQIVSVYREILELMNNVFIAFVAMEMGAYALFQALLKKTLAYQLYNSNNLLEKANRGFLGVVLLFWFCIILNIIMIIILKIVPDSFGLLQSQSANELLVFMAGNISITAPENFI